MIVSRNNQTLKSIAIALALTANAISANAQQLEEIIVTATHREESMQDVAVTVTALSNEMMQKADIFDAATIAQHTPGFAPPH